MTNNITNVITFKNIPLERLNRILEAIKNDKEGIGSIDFNKIIPMPDTVFKGSLGPEQREKYGTNNWLDWSVSNWNTKWNAFEFMPYRNGNSMNASQGEKPKATDSRIRDLMVNFAETGDELSYDKAKELFQNEVDFGEIESPSTENIIAFDTAWSAPHGVLAQLSKDYPEVRIQHQWFEEVMGFSVGVREYLKGEMVYENMPRDGSKEAYELAAEIQGEDLYDLGYRLSDDCKTYDYADEEDEPQVIEEKIKVVLVKPMQKPAVIEIDPGYKSMQLVVVGNIGEMMPFDEEVAIVCNEEGKNIGLALNRSIKDSEGEIYDIIAGDFFICAASGENFTSLSDEQVQRYCEKFKNPERFYRDAEGIKSVPIILNKSKDYER